MTSRPFIRAVLAGAAVMLVVLVAVHFLRRHQVPAPAAPAQAFNPAQFVQAPPRLDAPFVATDLEVVDAMLGMARVRPDDRVVDLGSGDGRILVAAARSYGAHGLGVDIDPARIREANANAQAAGVGGLVAFRREDLFRTSIGDADVLTLYLLPEINLRLRPRILAEMRPGSRVVSHDFNMGDWRWDQRRHIGTATIYLWIVPARAQGHWTLSADGHNFAMTLEQHYQDLTGTIAVGGREVRVEQGRLNGDLIRFLADLGRGRQTFEGRIVDNRIAPTNAGAGWHAARAG
jgi:SAM-dependent methyltransferase